MSEIEHLEARLVALEGRLRGFAEGLGEGLGLRLAALDARLTELELAASRRRGCTGCRLVEPPAFRPGLDPIPIQPGQGVVGGGETIFPMLPDRSAQDAYRGHAAAPRTAETDFSDDG